MLSQAEADVLALWAAHTHAIEAFEDTPFLAVTSAEPESGKTRVLEVLDLLVRHPWKVVLPSEAVLFRKVSAEQPTLLSMRLMRCSGRRRASMKTSVRS